MTAPRFIKCGIFLNGMSSKFYCYVSPNQSPSRNLRRYRECVASYGHEKKSDGGITFGYLHPSMVTSRNKVVRQTKIMFCSKLRRQMGNSISCLGIGFHLVLLLLTDKLTAYHSFSKSETCTDAQTYMEKKYIMKLIIINGWCQLTYSHAILSN